MFNDINAPTFSSLKSQKENQQLNRQKSQIKPKSFKQLVNKLNNDANRQIVHTNKQTTPELSFTLIAKGNVTASKKGLSKVVSKQLKPQPQSRTIKHPPNNIIEQSDTKNNKNGRLSVRNSNRQTSNFSQTKTKSPQCWLLSQSQQRDLQTSNPLPLQQPLSFGACNLCSPPTKQTHLHKKHISYAEYELSQQPQQDDSFRTLSKNSFTVSQASHEDLQGSFNSIIDSRLPHGLSETSRSSNYPSLELFREDSKAVLAHTNMDLSLNDLNAAQRETERKMTKHSNIYCSTSAMGNYQLRSNTQAWDATDSVFSRFSQKFKHYKRRNRNTRSLKLSDFQLIREIGNGKYGKVYLARHHLTGFLCALKSISKEIIRQQNLELPFTRQVKIQFYLDHPHIVKLYGFFQQADKIFLILEYCSGGHLLALMKETPDLSQQRILVILRNVFDAVSFIHCQGVIHRDLKPQNIVHEHDQFKLCDFGWAAYSCGDNRTTFCGTPLYVSPQVLRGEEYNSKADVWGLGVIFYQLAFRRVPFPVWSQYDMMRIVKDPVYFPAWSHVSPQLIALIKRMLQKNPEIRASMNEVLSNQLMQDIPTPSTPIEDDMRSVL